MKLTLEQQYCFCSDPEVVSFDFTSAETDKSGTLSSWFVMCKKHLEFILDSPDEVESYRQERDRCMGPSV